MSNWLPFCCVFELGPEFASWTWVMMSRKVYPCMLCFLCQRICLSCVLCVWQCLWIIWQNNSQYFKVWLLFCCWMLWKCWVCVEVQCRIDHAWSSKGCMGCVYNPRVHLEAPSICCVCVWRKLSPHLIVWELGFDLPLVFLCDIWRTMWSGKSMQLLYNLPLCRLCLFAIRMMFVKFNWQCVCWWVRGSGESGLCVFRKWCSVGFLVVGKTTSVLLHSIVMLYVDCGDDG